MRRPTGARGSGTQEIDHRPEPPDGFAAFVESVEPRLRRAFVGWCGVDRAADATAEALAWAWEHWSEVRGLANPAGYLYRVGQSRTRERLQGYLPPPEHLGLPEIEPALVPALVALPPRQRTAVWLVHACGWSYVECAEAMAISSSAVGTHITRGLASLRRRLEATDA